MNNRLSYQTTERPYTFTRGTVIAPQPTAASAAGTQVTVGFFGQAYTESIENNPRVDQKRGGLFCVGVESSYLT